ncbi:MAG: PQQ-dependent sugar dehydrogenase [Gemmatimonadota bacterium]
MSTRHVRTLSLLTLAVIALTGCSGVTDDPMPQPIEAEDGVIVVGYEEFARLPEAPGGTARPMLLVDEPGTGRMFVNDMWGPVHVVGYDGSVTEYLNVDAARWGVPVDASGRERGFQSFALHPDFGREGAPGFGKLYTWSDTEDTSPAADFHPGDEDGPHHTVLLEWTAEDPTAPAYDGGPPRELLRIEQPFGNHNAGHLAFNPLASPGDADFGTLYVGVADGGSGGDPLALAQNPASPFGKILRIDPLGSDGSTGEYGIPSDNPFAGSDDGTLPEIFASGLRNPQRFGWDPANGNLYVADIGQNAVEELSPVPAGGDLGWNRWEGSYRFVSRSGVDPRDPRSEEGVTFPVAEFDQADPLFDSRVAITGVVVPRTDRIPELRGRLLFGDMVSGEIFHVSADDLPAGGQDGIRRVLLREGGEPATLLEVMRARAEGMDLQAPSRTDLRFGEGPEGRLFLLNKHDGVIRELIP